MPDAYPINHALATIKGDPGTRLVQYARGRADIISLANGEGCLPTPGFIVEAAEAALNKGMTFYDRPLGLDALRREISDYYGRIYDCNVASERIFITNSGSNALNIALRGILNEGDEVVAVTPIWKNLLGVVELAGAHVRQVPLTLEKESWELDLDQLFEACSEKTKALLIVSPANPTGWIADDNTIKAILDFARSRNLWVISDEVYGRLTYDMPHAPSFLEHAGDHDYLMTINSFSKAWAMTGWRLGWITGPAFMAEKIRCLIQYSNLCASPFIQHAGIAALNDGEDFIANQLTSWAKSREFVMGKLRQNPKVNCGWPEAGFYAFFKHQDLPDCEEFCKALVDDAGLLLVPGASFGKDCKGFVRLSFACSRNKIEKAMDRLEQKIGTV